jgi:hypothetical protein
MATKPSFPGLFLGVYHAKFTCLSWNLFYPTVPHLESMLQVSVQQLQDEVDRVLYLKLLANKLEKKIITEHWFAKSKEHVPATFPPTLTEPKNLLKKLLCFFVCF